MTCPDQTIVASSATQRTNVVAKGKGTDHLVFLLDKAALLVEG